jgi:hypothetical protein
VCTIPGTAADADRGFGRASGSITHCHFTTIIGRRSTEQSRGCANFGIIVALPSQINCHILPCRNRIRLLHIRATIISGLAHACFARPRQEKKRRPAALNALGLSECLRLSERSGVPGWWVPHMRCDSTSVPFLQLSDLPGSSSLLKRRAVTR